MALLIVVLWCGNEKEYCQQQSAEATACLP
jgi:hypothetical protein